MSYLQLINREDSTKNFVVTRLEFLRSAINGKNCGVNGCNVEVFIDDMTNSIISTITYNFNKYSVFFDLEAHDKAYYIDQLNQIRWKVIDNMQNTDEKLANYTDRIRYSNQDIVVREFLKIGRKFLTDIEHVMKYSVEDIIKNQQEILK